MDQRDDPQFVDDPHLRAALKRALGAETAPQGLRQRVSDTLNIAESRSTMAASRQRLYRLAAVLLVGLVGLVAYIVWQNRERTAPRWFATSMAAAHDRGDGIPQPRVAQDLGNDQLLVIRKDLSAKAGLFVLAALPDDGWKYVGSGICELGNTTAGHLMFTRGDQTISIFSITDHVLYQNDATDSTTYAQTEAGHQIAGFRYRGGIHCVVGESKSGDLSLRDVIRIRDRLRAAAEG